MFGVSGTRIENLSDGTAAEGRSGKSIFLVFLVLFGLGMILISLVGEQGLISYLELKGEVEQLGRDVNQLESRQSMLVQKIRALRKDESYIELLARQKLGLARPGDRIIQLPMENQ